MVKRGRVTTTTIPTAALPPSPLPMSCVDQSKCRTFERASASALHAWEERSHVRACATVLAVLYASASALRFSPARSLMRLHQRSQIGDRYRP